MPRIDLQTWIEAPRERVFDLARSIDFHMHSTPGSSERAIAGVTSGLIGQGQEVTWEARHFGIRQQLRVTITAMDPPLHFQDVMIEGAFQFMRHDHHFEEHERRTRMVDVFEFAAPFGLLGQVVDALVLERYMRKLLETRNRILKEVAESEDWQRFLTCYTN